MSKHAQEQELLNKIKQYGLFSYLISQEDSIARLSRQQHSLRSQLSNTNNNCATATKRNQELESEVKKMRSLLLSLQTTLKGVHQHLTGAANEH